MSKNEINEGINRYTAKIKENKATVKKLTDIRNTLAEIAPAISLNEIDDEIATINAEIEDATHNIKVNKQRLRLLEKLEALG